ncbi:MAG TPA: leucyl aminopeptidase [Dehalococcoidia bacterium]|nr:leucyl aminopeptidase [Dehalococcoidia bacterium]
MLEKENLLNIKIVTDAITKIEADALIIGTFEGIKSHNDAIRVIDKALDGEITNLIARGEIKGKLNEMTIVHSMGKIPVHTIAIAGLGKRNLFSADKLRSVMAQSCRTLRRLNYRNIATILHAANEINSDISAQSIIEGSLLGLYTFRKYKTEKPDTEDVKNLIIVLQNTSRIAEIKRACKKGRILAEATMLTRDMVNEPSNYLTPTDMANMAMKLAKEQKLAIFIMDAAQMKTQKMGALLGVARGSQQPPKFIVMRYSGKPKSPESLGLVGKGITFDSGGISLKPSENMGDMKGDMAGGATVMAALVAIARLKLKINITAFIPATENLPSGTAIKPGDVLVASNGKTIEVISTDAEGRLILADALSYAVKQKLSKLVDVATLTGACHVALGDVCSGIFSNNQELADMLIEAGNKAGECMWQMPMNEEYKELNKSDVADIKNSGGRWGGAITAAQFLSEFVGDTPWVHIDIAGTSDTDKERGYLVKGATGTGVRTLVNLAESLSNKKVLR